MLNTNYSSLWVNWFVFWGHDKNGSEKSSAQDLFINVLTKMVKPMRHVPRLLYRCMIIVVHCIRVSPTVLMLMKIVINYIMKNGIKGIIGYIWSSPECLFYGKSKRCDCWSAIIGMILRRVMCTSEFIPAGHKGLLVRQKLHCIYSFIAWPPYLGTEIWWNDMT